MTFWVHHRPRWATKTFFQYECATAGHHLISIFRNCPRRMLVPFRRKKVNVSPNANCDTKSRFQDLFSYLDIGRYIKSALTFLQNPLRHVQELKQAETMIWTQQFVQIDQDKQTYEWAHKQSDSKENSCLMSLEQYFRIPMAENLEVCGSKRWGCQASSWDLTLSINRSAIQRMRREISKLHRPIAVRKLQERYPQALKDMEAPPSSIFRLDLVQSQYLVLFPQLALS